MWWFGVMCNLNISFFNVSLTLCGFGLISVFLFVLNKRQIAVGTEGHIPHMKWGALESERISDLSLWKHRHGFYSSAVLQTSWNCSVLSWILGRRRMQMGWDPSPVSLPHPPEKTGLGPQAASKRTQQKALVVWNSCFHLSWPGPGVEVSQFPVFHGCG